MAEATVTSKGQITIPIEVRRRLGVKSGDRLEFILDNGQVTLRPAKKARRGFAAWAGVAPAFRDKDEVVQWVREMRDED